MAKFCFTNPDYRLIRMTSRPNYSGLARVYPIIIIGLCVSNAIPMLKHYTKKTYGGVEALLHLLLTLALDGSEWKPSLPGHVTLGAY
jgi:hypothetical protein